MNPLDQQPTPQPPQTPPAPAAPTPTPLVGPAPMAAPTQAFNTTPLPVGPAPGPQPVKPKSKRGLVISLIIAAVVLLIAGIVAAVFLLIIPMQKSAAAKQVANNFFSAAAKNDSDALDKLSTPETRQDSHTVMVNLAKKAGKDCSVGNDIKQSKTNPLTYTVIGHCDSGAQTWTFTIIQQDGTWFIDSIVMSGKGASATSDEGSSNGSAAVADNGCLTFDQISELSQFYMTKDMFRASGYVTSETFFFDADSPVFHASYKDAEIADANAIADWAKKYSSRKFVITLQPKVQEETLSETGKALAAQRAEYLKTLLTDRGVSDSKIVIASAEAEGASNSDLASAYRNVVLEITGDDSCSS